MAKEQLSDKQQQILEFIKRRILDKGYPPAVREICEAVNLRSTSSVHSHLLPARAGCLLHPSKCLPVHL